MAGMLPGVELARRRRTNHHQFDNSHSHSHSRHPSLQRLQPSTTMDETALKARRRLEEKLRGSAAAATATASRLSKPPLLHSERRSFNQATQEKETQINSARVLERLPSHLDRRNSQREVCSICLDYFKTQEDVMTLACAHRYHSDCVRPWLSSHSHCPYCRTHVQQST